jgi:hypothetical protein
MKRKAIIVAATALLGAVAVFSVSGYAASVSTGTNSLGGGKSSVPTCGSNVTVAQVLNGSNQISQVIVGSIPSACGGGTAAVTVNTGPANSSGTQAVPAGGGSVTVTLGTPLTFKDAYETDVTVTGP